jgi:hypothetical protein
MICIYHHLASGMDTIHLGKQNIEQVGAIKNNYDVNDLYKRIFACCVSTRGLETFG